MSDTPRTEAEVNRQKCWSDDLITIDANFACQLERELNAANDRIKSLIEERDRANRLADWKWNLRGEFESLLGTDKISVCIQLERELNAANDKIKRLEEALVKITKEVPSHDGCGELFRPMFDGDGNEIGVQPVDPIKVIGAMHARALDAISCQCA